MSDPTTTQYEITGDEGLLYVALELSNSKWKVASGVGPGRPRRVDVSARDVPALLEEISNAKARYKIAANAAVVSCYEAGRDGFWLHRMMVAQGIRNLVVDPGSIEVNRRGRRAKTDRLDVEQLHAKLIRYCAGDTKVWSVVRVPPEEAEDARRLHRELERLKKDRTRLRNRIWSDLALVGRRPGRLDDFFRNLSRQRMPNGQALPPFLCAGLKRTWAQLRLLKQQIKELESHREKRVRRPRTESERKSRALSMLCAVGPVSSWNLVHEFFGWRKFRNRREVAAAAGLVGTPHSSGQEDREQGISKAGNRRVRALMIEISWLWLRLQPDSKISRWWREHYEAGGKRMRKVGIVAVARRLLIALWRMLEFGEIPEGARLKMV